MFEILTQPKKGSASQTAQFNRTWNQAAQVTDPLAQPQLLTDDQQEAMSLLAAFAVEEIDYSADGFEESDDLECDADTLAEIAAAAQHAEETEELTPGQKAIIEAHYRDTAKGATADYREAVKLTAMAAGHTIEDEIRGRGFDHDGEQREAAALGMNPKTWNEPGNIKGRQKYRERKVERITMKRRADTMKQKREAQPPKAPQPIKLATVATMPAVDPLGAAIAEVNAEYARLAELHPDRRELLEKSLVWQIGDGMKKSFEFSESKGRTQAKAIELWKQGAFLAAAAKCK